MVTPDVQPPAAPPIYPPPVGAPLGDPRPVLVTGATGYVGGRLVPRLLAAGHRVRALARDPRKLAGRAWSTDPGLEIAAGDVLDEASLAAACRGCRAAYWLVHSMDARHADFAEADRRAAAGMARAAAAAGLERIVYLGGLGEDGPDLSPHLRSRAEVARVLASGPVPVTTLRAGMILGSGSASFEILRYLVDRLPAMVTPRWVGTPCQPVAIRDVLGWLVGVLDAPAAAGRTFDVGGPEVLTYRRLMEVYAEEAGLPRRWIVPVPILSPRLSSYWIHLVTPVPAALARPLAEGLRNPVVAHDDALRTLLPRDLLTPREAIRLALERFRHDATETHWTDAGRLPAAEWSDPDDPAWAGGTVREDVRRVVVAAPIDRVWAPVARLGGRTGWYHADALWALRGRLDRLVGGVGLRRGRRHPVDLRVGDALDFWRVLEVDPPRRLRLVAEMRLPGRATLSIDLRALDAERTEIVSTARFAPRGLLGLAYWTAVAPMHHGVFNGLLKGLAKAARARVLEGPEIVRARRRAVPHAPTAAPAR